MRFFLAIIVGKLVHLLGSRIGKATNLPGELALKICPSLFSKFKFKGKILAVTGSNGKTTTSNIIAHILRNSGYSVAHNAKGSNLTGGIATTLLTAGNFSGYINKDYVVLEVDERYSRLIFKDFQPDYLLCTNLFRDQLTRNGNVDVIIEKLTEAIGPKVKLILNANDPISGDLAKENERVYYKLEKTSQSPELSVNLTHDAKVCPRCFGKMQYDFFHYNHIGQFECTNCHYSTPSPMYTADNVDFEAGDFTINGIPVHTDYKAPFHFLNVTGAVAACTEIGVPFETSCRYASSFVMLSQRFDEFKIGDRTAVMILSKNQNPVSFDQSISYVLEQKGEKTVVAFVNNINHTNHRDTTWLYDIGFERLKDHVDSVVCTGPRAYDLAVRLNLADFEADRVQIATDLKDVKEAVAKTKGTIYILTELYDAQAIVKAIG